MKPRLILVEGMIGAGRSTTAEQIAAWLRDRGEDVRHYAEFADDHPIRTMSVDLARFNDPRSARMFDDIEDGLAVDPGLYRVDQWRRFAQRCLRSGQTAVLDSTLLQNSVLPRFASGAPPETVTEAFTRIADAVAPARPLLVYLRPTDVDAALTRVHRARGVTWAAWNVASVSGLGWARTRSLRGRAALVEMYEAWDVVVCGLIAERRMSSVVINDPQDDRERAMARIRAAARSS